VQAETHLRVVVPIEGEEEEDMSVLSYVMLFYNYILRITFYIVIYFITQEM
jgi:hypothetical protein